MDKYLHIVAFDQPEPPNYGGAIDVFYKIKALHSVGVKIILHIFDYGRGRQAPKLQLWCKEVHYYKRHTGINGFSLLRPYIVHSRKNSKLLTRLKEDNYPILFEGLHTTYYLHHPSLSERKKFVRAHNVEHSYYKQLAVQTNSFFKKLYYSFEADLLKRYQIVLQNAQGVFAISENDYLYFEQKYPAILVSAFHSNEKISAKEGQGDFCLYHGNLQVEENIKTAEFLIDVFSMLDVSLKITGANPPKTLLEKVELFDHIECIPNPSVSELDMLMQDAHIHLMHAEQQSGIKLKWINALYQGRFIIGNDKMFTHNVLKKLCFLAATKDDYRTLIKKQMNVPFTKAFIEERRKILLSEVGNEINTQRLLDAIWS